MKSGGSLRQDPGRTTELVTCQNNKHDVMSQEQCRSTFMRDAFFGSSSYYSRTDPEGAAITEHFPAVAKNFSDQYLERVWSPIRLIVMQCLARSRGSRKGKVSFASMCVSVIVQIKHCFLSFSVTTFDIMHFVMTVGKSSASINNLELPYLSWPH